MWVVLVVWQNYPGVACFTPAAWLLIVEVGFYCVRQLHGTANRIVVIHAVAARVIYGLLTGILFYMIIPGIGPYAPDEIRTVIWLGLILLFIGIVGCGAVSGFSAWLQISSKRFRTPKG